MNFKNVILLALFITAFYLTSNASRSGGSRGFRWSLVRSHSSGGKTRNIISYRYNSWFQKHGYSPTFRYTSTSYNYKRIGIITGLIIISDHQRSRFDVNRMSSYGSISICYNEFALYDRNTTLSPWFVCPWNDSSSSYCCGDQFEEYCCRYFDRRGHLAGLIVGIIIIIVFFGISYKYFCKRIQNCRKPSAKFVYKPAEPNSDKFESNSLVATVNNSPPECPPYTTEINIFPLYPPSMPLTENCHKYPLDPIMPLCPTDSFPQYPVSPTGFIELNANEYHSQQPSAPYSSSDDCGSLSQNEKPPPSYSDVMRS